MPPFFPRNTRVGKCQKWASIFGKNAKFDVFGENAKNAIHGSLDFRASPKTDFAKNEISIYSGNPLYPQKTKSFILTYFLFQGILGLPSSSWLTLSFFSLISRYSSIFKAFSMVLSKRKRPHRTVFPPYKVFIFSLFYSFPRLKIFAP